jgi:WD40 repeat protein
MSRIFISHSSTDNFEALAMRGWLASEGWNDVFLDLDPERGIAAGERWERALHAAASRCEAVIFLVSSNWLDSGWCMKEYALARGLNKKLFAALIDSAKTIGSLPAELNGVWQIVDLVHGQDLQLFAAQPPGVHEERHIGYSRSGLMRLKTGLVKAGLDARFFAWPPPGEPNRLPYRGLKPQDAADAGIFFGRDAPIIEAIDALRGLRAAAPPRLFAILGASGAGKSSFLRAGLLPRLARDDTQFIPLPPIRPERAALTGERGFVNALAAILPARARAEVRDATLAGAAEVRPLLAELIKDALARRVMGDENERPPAFVIAIDQAEELFRAEGLQEGAALMALLADLAANDDSTVIIIFTIRTDSYDDLQKAAALEGLRQTTFSLAPMPRGAYQDVIEGPARRIEEGDGKLAIEPALTQRLMADIEAGTGDALPLLAFTLEQLYLDYHQTGALRLRDYQKFGGLNGAIDAAVERAFARADVEPRIPRERAARLDLLRRGLIPWLAGVDPDSKSPRRNIARRVDIPAEAAPLIDLLVEERLLAASARKTRDPVTGGDVTEATIEPTHEALLRQWGLLDGWLAQDFGLLTTLEAVKRAARDWDANARGDSWAAHRDQRLAEAQALDVRPDIAARLDATDRAYLSVCRAQQNMAEQEARDRQAEREAERQRQIEDAEAKAELERRRRRTATYGVAAVSVLACVALGVAGYAFIQKRSADEQRWLAEKRQLAAERSELAAQTSMWMARSKSDIVSNHIRDALTDALTAFKLSPNAQTRSAMLSAALELSPELDAAWDFTAFGKAAAVEWIDKDVLAVANWNGQIQISDVPPGEPPVLRATWQGPSLKGFETRPATIVTLKKLASGGILAFYDNGEAASFATDGKAVKTWTVARAQEGETVTIQGRPATSGDGSVVAVTTAAGSALVKCSNIEGTAPPHCETLVNSPAATAASVSDDGRWAAFGASDGRVSIHNLEDAAAPAREVSVGAKPIRGLAFDPGGNLIVSSSDRQFSVVDALDLTIKSPIGIAAQPVGGLGLTLDNESKIVAYGCGSSADESRARELCLRTLEASGDAELAEPRGGPRLNGPESDILSMAIAPGGKAIAALDVDNYVYVWRLPASFRTNAKVALASGSPWVGVSAVPGGKVVAAADESGGLVSMQDGRPAVARRVSASSGAAAVAMARSRDATFVVYDDGSLSVAPDDGSPSRSFDLHAEVAERGLAWSGKADGAMFLTKDGQVGLLDPSVAPEPVFLDDKNAAYDGATALAVDPDRGRAYVQYDPAAAIRIIDLTKRQFVGELRSGGDPATKHPGGVGTNMSLSNDGHWLATTSLGRDVLIYDLNKPGAVSIVSNSAESEGVAFAPDSRRLATIDDNEQVRIWDLTSADKAYSLEFLLPERSEALLSTRPSVAWSAGGALAAVGRTAWLHMFDLNEDDWGKRDRALGIVERRAK